MKDLSKTIIDIVFGTGTFFLGQVDENIGDKYIYL